VKRRAGVLFGFLILSGRLGFADTLNPALSQGIAEFEKRRWMAAMGNFLQVLATDPANKEAHAYLNLIAENIDSDQREQVRDIRLTLLTEASKRLGSNRQDTKAVDQAIAQNSQTEARHRQEALHAECVMAQMEDRLGHLAAANDMVLQVIAQDPGNAEAQRMLSDLQAQIHERIDAPGNLAPAERAALEGFYAYGQADYPVAADAWARARAALQKTVPPNHFSDELALLHFETYEKTALAYVGEKKHQQDEQALFSKGMTYYQKGSYALALASFKKLALINPEYPQLGTYLAQSEANIEKERTQRLTQDNRDRASDAYAKGLSALEKNQYPEARKAFREVLALDPSNPQAMSYLSVVETEMTRQHDPHAAQLHYETGLVRYASGKLEDAEREWRIAAQLDPENPKFVSAFNKARKELAMYREVPE